MCYEKLLLDSKLIELEIELQILVTKRLLKILINKSKIVRRKNLIESTRGNCSWSRQLSGHKLSVH